MLYKHPYAACEEHLHYMSAQNSHAQGSDVYYTKNVYKLYKLLQCTLDHFVMHTCTMQLRGVELYSWCESNLHCRLFSGCYSPVNMSCN